MDHKTKIFTFVDNSGKEGKYITRAYTFAVEEILNKRFGRDKIKQVFQEKRVDFEFDLKAVEEDFPRLLAPLSTENIYDVDWAHQDYDELLSVYAFFLLYKKNAMLRELEFNKETIALSIRQAQEILDSMPEIFSRLRNSTDTPDI